MQVRKLTKNIYQTKRGDTIIEVMFAIAVFCLVAVISVAMMNMGVAQAEGSLEVVTTRNELNAQAEALRFIHSSYISELTLPEYQSEMAADEKYQQYTKLWKAITESAIDSTTMTTATGVNMANLGDVIVQGCSKIYENDNKMLTDRKAFVLNTRDLQTIPTGSHQVSPDVSFIPTVQTSYGASGSVTSKNSLFTESPLNARIIFKNDTGNQSTNSDVQYLDQAKYNRVAKVEGLWIIAVRGKSETASAGSTEEYYDFYIQSCWNGPTGNTPQSIDTVIRLYNPEGM